MADWTPEVHDMLIGAIRFARERFGADENGCICLVSEIPDDDGGGLWLDS